MLESFAAADVEAVIARRDSVNFGQAFENAVAQELRAHRRERLYYYSTPKVGEVDFLVEDRRMPGVLPVEVKSGRFSTKHVALDRLMRVENYALGQAVVLHVGNVARDGAVRYLPLYMAGLL